jgi:hypothetical protein
MNKFYALLLLLTIFCLSKTSAQTQKDTIYTHFTKTPVVIDGSDADACWSTATWHAIDKVWLPHITDVMKEGDFAGKFKVAWDTNYLYLLVEVKDDSLSDDHKSPTDNYWNDDCVEIFIDEDRSKGNHQYTNNAFAYHVSIYYDAIDGGTGTTVNLRNNMSVVMDTIADDTYLWEFAIKIYNSSFNMNKPESSRVKLAPNKLMGFSLAYCDNDETTERENFIGSMIMTEANRNDNYITADFFGTMLLVDTNKEWVSVKETTKKLFSVYPNPASNVVNLTSTGNGILEICSTTGKIIRTERITENSKSIEIGHLANGVYLFKFSDSNGVQSKLIIKK